MQLCFQSGFQNASDENCRKNATVKTNATAENTKTKFLQVFFNLLPQSVLENMFVNNASWKQEI